MRSKVTEIFIELNCINVFNDFFLYSLRACATIYEKNEKYFTGEIIELEEQNTDNSLDEEISNFSVLLYTQRILSSMMGIVINFTNTNFTFCRMCVEGEFISTILRLLEIYLPFKDDQEMKVCFYNEPLFATIWEKVSESFKGRIGRIGLRRNGVLIKVVVKRCVCHGQFLGCLRVPFSVTGDKSWLFCDNTESEFLEAELYAQNYASKNIIQNRYFKRSWWKSHSVFVLINWKV